MCGEAYAGRVKWVLVGSLNGSRVGGEDVGDADGSASEDDSVDEVDDEDESSGCSGRVFTSVGSATDVSAGAAPSVPTDPFFDVSVGDSDSSAADSSCSALIPSAAVAVFSLAAFASCAALATFALSIGIADASTVNMSPGFSRVFAFRT